MQTTIKYTIYNPIALERLIKNGFDPNKKDKNNVSPIILATSLNLKRSVDILLKLGTFPDTNTKQGFTSLHISSKFGYFSIAKSLLQAGADPNHSNNDYKTTPLHISSSNDRLDITKLLLEFKANVNAINIIGDTPLHDAVENGFIDIVKTLLEHFADVNKLNNNYHIPIFYAKNAEIKNILQEKLKL